MNPMMKRVAGFAAIALLSAGAADAASMLAGANGMTLYTFDKDTGGKSTCYAQCAANWPPYMVKKAAKMGQGWTEITRKDGKKQWAYDGKPVYFFKGDKAKGDAKGDGLMGLWHVIKEG